MASQHAVFLAAGIVIVLLLLIFSGGTAAVAAVAAWIALMRHFAQTDADRQRRISESYSRGVEQLSSEKMEVRLGGIYTLEHVSRESRDDY
jgi:lipopolysaccharide biosynthesis regulator YciM